MNLRKIGKPLQKILKELRWRKYKLNLMIKRFDKRKFEPLNNLNRNLQNGLNFIVDAISEIEEGLKQFRNIIFHGGLETKPKNKTEIKTNEVEVFEVLLCGIKLHIKPEMLIVILRSCFLKKKVLLLLENNLKYLKDTIITFFDFIFEDSFENNIKTLTKDEYLKKKNSYNNYIVVENNNVSVYDLNHRNQGESKFEEEIIGTYYEENDVSIGRENLRFKLQEIYSLSKAILEYYRMRGNILVPKAAIKHLENTFFLKIKKDYFHFLVDIVSNYSNIEIKYAKDYVADQIAHLMGT